jgi:hypothetical protein
MEMIKCQKNFMDLSRLSIFLLVLGLVSSLWALEPSGTVSDVLNNGKYLVSAPLRIDSNDWPWLVSVGGMLGGAFASDEELHDTLKQHENSKAATDLRHYGDVAAFAGPVMGTIYSISAWSTEDPHTRFMARLTWESLLWSSVFELSTKYVVGRKRPDETDQAFVFNPFSGNMSFPSGHTTYAFTAATLASEEYDTLYVQIPAYAAAGAVGFSRLYADKHWLSDVVAGAWLGFAVPHTLRKQLENKKSGATDSSFIFTGKDLVWVKRF